MLTDRVSEVNGTATLRNQEATVYTVVVFAEDPALWTFPTRYLRTARADTQGRFMLRGLPGGTPYLVAAVDYVEDGEWQDPEFLERLREQRVTPRPSRRRDENGGAQSHRTLRTGPAEAVTLDLLAR